MKKAPEAQASPAALDLGAMASAALGRLHAQIHHSTRVHSRAISDQVVRLKQERKVRALERFSIDEERAATDPMYRNRKQVELQRLRASVALGRTFTP